MISSKKDLWDSLILGYRAFLVLWFLFLVAATPVLADGISVSQSVDRFSIPFEDSLQFEIVLEWNGPQSAYLFTNPLDLIFDRLQVRGFTSSISSSGAGENEITTKRFRYTLAPISSGAATIAPVTISFVTWPDSIPVELVTEAMSVQIAEPLPPAAEDGIPLIWIIVIALVLVGGAGVFVLARLARKRKAREVVKAPAQQFLEKLTDIKQNSGGDLKQFQAGLYDSLSAFLLDQYGIMADRLSDEELEQALVSTNLPDSYRVQISQWLIRARQDKFRPVSGTPGEITQLECAVRAVFEKL
ncbi:MAG: hypothetical protein AB1744_11895 [Candidatus Zixiibacteriota bacterium]